MILSHRRNRTRTAPRRRNYRSENLESFGPQGEKIRGTATQIVEKYRQLARDCMASDKTLAESYNQHADHYIRINLGDDFTNTSNGNASGATAVPTGGNNNDGLTQREVVNQSNQPQPDIAGSFDSNPTDDGSYKPRRPSVRGRPARQQRNTAANGSTRYSAAANRTGDTGASAGSNYDDSAMEEMSSILPPTIGADEVRTKTTRASYMRRRRFQSNGSSEDG